MSRSTIQIFSVAVLFPAAYVLLSISPLSLELFVKNNTDYFIPFWGLIIVLHLITLYIVSRFLKSNNEIWSSIGYTLTRRRTIIMLLGYFALAIIIFAFIELTLANSVINQNKLQNISNFFPKTTGQRLLFILSVPTAAFCEEIIYRGFLINRWMTIGCNRWLAVLMAGLSFVFIHGYHAYNQFWFYYIPALIFGILFIVLKRTLSVNIGIHLLIDLSAMFTVLEATEPIL